MLPLKPVAKVYFRSFASTRVALNLDGIEFDGSLLSVKRPVKGDIGFASGGFE